MDLYLFFNFYFILGEGGERGECDVGGSSSSGGGAAAATYATEKAVAANVVVISEEGGGIFGYRAMPARRSCCLMMAIVSCFLPLEILRAEVTALRSATEYWLGGSSLF